LQLQFIIHFLPVSSGFRMDTLAFRSLLRVVYALPTAQGTCSTNAQLSSAISRMTLGSNVVCYITDDSWRKCRLLYHGWLLAQMSSAISRMTLGASVVCYITDHSWHKCRLLYHGWLLAQLSSAISRMTLGATVVRYITDDSWRKCRLLDHGYTAIVMTPGPAAMLCPGFCTGSWQKRSKRSKRLIYCGYIRTLRSLPDHGGDVCEVWFRSVQKCGFV
jgi:hypothetical protein